ncbi:MAG: hypothetical protein OGM16_12830 [Lachnospiraceae bacterium]|nr:MAG: hypothetical protein OGM16_12830 [Lachnospiraceae bacterium]
MASVKVSAHSLEQQKKEYEKAVKNLDNALEQIKKVNASLGKDAMLDGVRQALTKLAASLETRAGVILLMTKALEQSNAKYTAAQKKAVTKSNQFRAHNRDFYGNPVVVTVVAGGAGATAGALSGAAAVAETTGTTPAASNVASGTVTDASNTVSGTGGSVHIKSQGTVNVSSQTDSDIRQAVYTQRGPSATIAQVSEHARNVAAPKATDSLTDIPEKETVAMASEIPEPGSAPAVTGAVAAGAAIGSIAGGSIKRIKQPEPFTKEKKQDPSTDIEAQLEVARERLRRFNEMEMEEKE